LAPKGGEDRQAEVGSEKVGFQSSLLQESLLAISIFYYFKKSGVNSKG
jgi:hypothetical protein